MNLGEKIFIFVTTGDRTINSVLTSWRNDNLDIFFFWITSFGSWPIIVSIAIIISSFLYVKNKKSQIIPFLLAWGGANLTSVIGKLYFARLRPIAPTYWEHNFSFPSSHAANSIFIYGFIIYFLIGLAARREQKIFLIPALILLILLILLIGFSRLFLGVHYLSDVISGYLIGALWLLVAIRGDRLFSAQKK